MEPGTAQVRVKDLLDLASERKVDESVYVLCTYGGDASYEPYVAVFRTAEEAMEHWASLPLDPVGGGAFFVERHVIGKPDGARQVLQGQ